MATSIFLAILKQVEIKGLQLGDRWQPLRKIQTAAWMSCALAGLHADLADAGGGELRVPAEFPSIQEAIDFASSKDTVIVSPGVYSEQIDFLGKDIVVRSQAGPGSTILDGLGVLAPLVTFSDGEPRTAWLQGFTLTGANGRFEGAILVRSSPTIIGNVIRNNQACVGAGLRVVRGRDPLPGPYVTRNVISDNRNTCSGGGGAAVSVFFGRVELEGNLIEGNLTWRSRGAALYFNGGLDSVVSRNVFLDNFSEEGHGGAIAIINHGFPRVEQNLFVGNRAQYYGGAIADSSGRGDFSNNTFIENDALSGTFLYLDHRASSSAYYNNVVVGTGAAPLFRCDSRRLELPVFIHTQFHSTGDPVVDGPCSDNPASFGNQHGDPLLASNFAPLRPSPLIDTGSLMPPGVGDRDLLGQPRVIDGDADGVARIDIGAIEAQANVLEVPLGSTLFTSFFSIVLALAALLSLRRVTPY